MVVLKDFKVKKEKVKVRKKKTIADKYFSEIEDYVKKNKGTGRRSKKVVVKDRMKRKKKRKRIVADVVASVKTGIEFTEAELVASICRDSFYTFVKEFWETIIHEKPVWNWHIEYLCNELQEMAERVFKGLPKKHDLVVNIPPGTTKSTIMSVMFPAWLWTRMPSCQFIGASHNDDLALELSTKCRDIIKSDKYRECFPEIQLREDQDTKTKFQNTQGGWRFAVGVNGGVIGKHAHVIVIDDPIDVLKASSGAELKKATYWIDHQLSSRKVNKDSAIMILVMQRLHQDDPTASFLKRKKVKHVCLPAERTEKINPPELVKYYTKLGGRLLDAERLNHKVLAEEKTKGNYYYASQYLQDPVPLGGGMFKVRRLKRGKVPPNFKKVVRYWDKAGTASGEGAFTVGCKMGLDYEGRFWILDVIRVRLDSFEREQLIQRTAMNDGRAVRIGIEQEPGSGGKESAETTAKYLAGYKVEIQRAAGTASGGLGSKEERADPFSVQMNAGNVYIPDYLWDEKTNDWVSDSWVPEWVDEHRYFPNSRYKDQVDASSGAFSICFKPTRRIGGMMRKQDTTRKGFLMQFV